MDTPQLTRNDLKSTDSNVAVKRQRFVPELLITHAFCLLLSIGIVAFEFFGIYLHYGLVRPVWIYILGGAIAAILVVYVVTSLVQLADRNRRLQSLHKRTMSMHQIIAMSLFGVFFMSYSVLTYSSDTLILVDRLIHFVAGFGVGFFIAALLFAVLGLTMGPRFFGVNEMQSQQ